MAEIEPVVISKALLVRRRRYRKGYRRASITGVRESLDPLVKDTNNRRPAPTTRSAWSVLTPGLICKASRLAGEVVTAFLAVAVGVLVITLRRQLKSVRSAAMAFEVMAHELNELAWPRRRETERNGVHGHDGSRGPHAPECDLGTAELLELGELSERVRGSVQDDPSFRRVPPEILNEILDFAKMEKRSD